MDERYCLLLPYIHCASGIGVLTAQWMCSLESLSFSMEKALWQIARAEEHRESLRLGPHCFSTTSTISKPNQTNTPNWEWDPHTRIHAHTHSHTLGCHCRARQHWKSTKREKGSDKVCSLYVECFYCKFSGIPPYCWHRKKYGVNSTEQKKNLFFFTYFTKH